MQSRVLILGAGFAGSSWRRCCRRRSGTRRGHADRRRRRLRLRLLQARRDVRKATPAEVRLPYAAFVKPGVRLLRETVTAIDPAARRVTTDARRATRRTSWSSRSAPTTTWPRRPGSPRRRRVLSVEGASRLREVCRRSPRPRDGRYLRGAVQVPARAERCALMLHDNLIERGVRDDCEIELVMPFEPGSAFAGNLRRAAQRVRRARHRVRARTQGEPRWTGARRRRARRRQASWL